jgi:hypothetical protein
MTNSRDLANLGGGFIQAGGGVQRSVESKLQDVVSVLDFIPQSEHAAIKAGTSTYDATAAIQAAINSVEASSPSASTGTALYFPRGVYYITGTLNLTKQFTLTGDVCKPSRSFNMSSALKFADNGTTTDNRVGLSAPGVGLSFEYLRFTTTAGDARNDPGNFVWVKGAGGSAQIHNCIFDGCAGAALELSDIGYATFRDLIFRYNNVGFKSTLINWPAATTASFLNVHCFQNLTGIDASYINHSSFIGCIWEFNQIGCANFQNNCIFESCYAEANSQYGAYSPAAASATFLNNFSYQGSSGTNQFIVAGSTGSYGFDSIGAFEVDGNTLQSRQLKFVDRVGNAVNDRITASHTAASGQLGISDGTNFLGRLMPFTAKQNSGTNAKRCDLFMVKGSTVYNAPAGWVVTKTGTGVWQINYTAATLPGDTRWPFVFAQAVNDVSTPQYQSRVIMRDTGTGVWGSAANATRGFDVRILDSTGVAVDGAAFIMCIW